MPPGIAAILFLAVIQGLTEFLPVSSSGHLVIVESLLGFRGEQTASGIIFEIAVHIGTLGAIVIVYRSKLAAICNALISFVFSGFRRSGTNSNGVAYAGWIIFGSIPAAFAGVVFHDRIAGLFDSPALTSILLVATGCYLLLSKSRGGDRSFSWKTVILIGLAQAVAILPGCSRSGWTITTALLFGFGFEKAAEFSFLLSIPAILGALVFELFGNPTCISGGAIPGLLIGAATAFLSGWVALRLLLHALKLGIFHRFAYYLIPVGSAAYLFFTFLR